MVDSPLDSLYYMIKSVFTPALRENKSNTNTSQQIQTSLSELEQVLRSASRRSDDGSSSMSSIFHPRDEIRYWTDAVQYSSSKSGDPKRANYFLDLFSSIKAEFDKLDK